MIAIGVIVILAGFLIMGLSKVKNTAQAQATKVTLESLRGMLGEYETATRFAKSPPAWLWPGGPIVSAENFWRNPTPNPATNQRDLDAPGEVTGEGDAAALAARNASRAVMNTTLAMDLIAKVSANRTALQQIPQDKLWIPEWTTQSYKGSGPDGVMLTNDDNNSELVVYLKDMRVSHQGRNYICTQDQPGATPPAPGMATPWKEDAAATPMLKDGWGNPIIFVPATGLRVRMLLDEKSLDPSLQKQTRVVTSAGLVDPYDTTLNYNTASYRAPAGAKPFFASAGPDGNFATGDDNVYSFEN